MEPSPARTPLAWFRHWEHTTPDRVWLRQPVGAEFRTHTWREAGAMIRRLAGALRAQDLPTGSSIAIHSRNCAEWLLVDFAIWMAGHVSVPIYPGLQRKRIREQLTAADARFVFVGHVDDPTATEGAIPPGVPVVHFGYHDFPAWPTLAQFTAGETAPLPPEPTLDTTATIVFTSGTGGEMKGVMHSFAGFAFVAQRLVDTLGRYARECFFSYLSLAHVAERVFAEGVVLAAGGEITFLESAETFHANLVATRPTIFFGVPRIWERIRAETERRLPPGFLARMLASPAQRSAVKERVRAELGLDRARFLISGAAPLAPDIVAWFAALGMPIREAYGHTETFALSHFDRAPSPRFGTVGTAWPGVEARREASGEIVVRSPALMRGYFRAPERTGDVLTEDGAFRTGDLGTIDADGVLTIHGRLRDLFKTSKGRYVCPAGIEAKLARYPLIVSACVIGRGLDQPVALVRVEDDGRERGEVLADLDTVRRLVNETLDDHERISHFILLSEAWDRDETLRTPTHKLRRAEVERRYAHNLTRWARRPDPIVFS